MNFKRAKDNGTLSKTAYILGLPYYTAGMLADIYCNLVPISLIMLELPRIQDLELTTTARMTRLSKTGGWRAGSAAIC